MREPTINGNCPDCGLGPLSVLMEGITSYMHAGSAICLVVRCCRCRAILVADASSRDAFDVATRWFRMSEEEIEFIFGPRDE